MIKRRTDEPPLDALRTLETLKRAALRAREVARATGTRLVVVEDGVIKNLTPEELDARDISEQSK